jgi:serine/threonine protein kinase
MKLSPSPGNLNPWSTEFGKRKYETTPVDRISNKRAASTIHTDRLPERVLSASGFMKSFVTTGYTKLTSGVHGDVYVLEDTFKLGELYDTLQNRVTHVLPHTIKNTKTKIILKVIAIPDDERMTWWGPDSKKLRSLYLRGVTDRTVKKHVKSGKHMDQDTVRMIYSNVRANFNTRLNDATRKTYLDDYRISERENAWRDILREGSVDATNHKHLVTTPDEPIRTPSGTIHLKASDVVPEFYFAGSSARHGVYVIAMGIARGSTAAGIRKLSPDIVANIEKAILTLAIAGVEHGDLHTGNIMVDTDASVKLIDFGMTSILPDSYRLRASRVITRAVSTLLGTGTWPESNTNNFWYNPTEGIMRYMNSYMTSKYKNQFSWYNPSGKFLLYAKSHPEKSALDRSRMKIWMSSIKRKKRALNYSNL